jgi:hypothetical protein
MALRTRTELSFHSGDRELERGFERLKGQALHWVFEGYPVGDYYEAALPGRDAFCMRDTSHQAAGAEALGLSRHNKNMLLKFAGALGEERDYCSFWEIDRWGRPCPVDYTDDSDFWYNLPANFDLIHAAWRLYLWTGDRDYLCHPVFDRFYALSLENYVRRWDHDGDGIPDAGGNGGPGAGRRGIAGYDESGFARGSIVTAADTAAALGRACLSYGEICGLLGRREQEGIYRNRGEAVFDRLDRDFYSPGPGYAPGLDGEGRRLYRRDENGDIYAGPGAALLYWDAIRDLSRIPRLLDLYAAQMPLVQIEGLSHYPELQWRYGREGEALVSLRRLMDPALPRKEYPEASFCALGAMASGLMGFRPDAKEGRLSTLPGLGGLGWAEMNRVPLLGRRVSLCHEGENASTLTLEEGEALPWRCCFPGGGRIRFPVATAGAGAGVSPFSGKP